MGFERDEDHLRAPDAIARRIAMKRRDLGWSLAALARAAGLKSPAYVLHIERGEKVPSPDVAERLALALGEDPRAFAAWAQLRSGSGTLDDALASARVAERAVRSIVRDKRHDVAFWGDAPEDEEPLEGLVTSRMADLAPEPRPPDPSAWPGAIPVLTEGEDPDGPGAGANTPTIRLRMPKSPQAAAHLDRLVSPFAYRLTRHSARRAPLLLPPGFYAVVSRDKEPLQAHEAYAVRYRNRIELGHVHWDGARLALLPFDDPGDLVLRSVTNDDQLHDILVGRIAIVAAPEMVVTERRKPAPR